MTESWTAYLQHHALFAVIVVLLVVAILKGHEPWRI